MDDRDLLGDISELVEEEHRLRQAHEGDGVSEEDAARLRKVEIDLDRCWDLLRQRRARRDAGEDPDGAAERDAGTVEHYQQ